MLKIDDHSFINVTKGMHIHISAFNLVMKLDKVLVIWATKAYLRGRKVLTSKELYLLAAMRNVSAIEKKYPNCEKV